MTQAVRRTVELERILALPRRSNETGKALVGPLTQLLKRPGGTQTLRPLQALALHDIGLGAGFCPMGVGDGKTIVSLMAAYLIGAERPLLFLPASLIFNAERAIAETLSPHWRIPQNIRIVSYEMLGRVTASKLLEKHEPDLIIADEVHKLKNLHAACTRRVARYMAAHPETAFVALSGTVMRDSILDFAHLLWWSLKRGTPLPQSRQELEEWALAIDEPKPGKPGMDYSEIDPGALLDLCSEVDRNSDSVVAARRGFRRRLIETPGVIASDGEGEKVDSSIYIRGRTYEVKPITNEHFSVLRKSWERPDGKPFEQGVEVWACARQLAIGLHYEWNPPPPKEWMDARRGWSKYVRGVLSHSRSLDSPNDVAQAILAGRRPDPGNVLAKWSAIRGTFKPKTVPVWHDDSVLQLCAAWGKEPGIIWTEHWHFGQRLAKETGLPYFGRKGFSEDGTYIQDNNSKTIIASIQANRDGKDLQFKWNRNLIVSPPEGWDVVQQTIGRTHRQGQPEDEVIVDVLMGCREHVKAWRKAVAGTHAARDTVGGTPKLLLADVSGFPTEEEIATFRGARW